MTMPAAPDAAARTAGCRQWPSTARGSGRRWSPWARTTSTAFLPASLRPGRGSTVTRPHTGAAAQPGTAAGETAPSSSRRRTVARVVAA
ncbi:hypothetical protein [Streptomyces avermitilis]|uniref:hypothetical protein n=1 Tax=Streptomyces avermitilis TaxID=33903 RepID=UPI0036B69763